MLQRESSELRGGHHGKEGKQDDERRLRLWQDIARLDRACGSQDAVSMAKPGVPTRQARPEARRGLTATIAALRAAIFKQGA